MRADTANKKRNLEQDIKSGIAIAKKKIKQAANFIKNNGLEPIEAKLKSHRSGEATERRPVKEIGKSRFKGLTKKMHAAVNAMRVRMAEATPLASPLKEFFLTKTVVETSNTTAPSKPTERPSPTYLRSTTTPLAPADETIAKEATSVNSDASLVQDTSLAQNKDEPDTAAWDSIGYVKDALSQHDEIFSSVILLVCFENEKILMSGFQYLDYVRPQEQISIAIFVVVDYLDAASAMLASQSGRLNHG